MDGFKIFRFHPVPAEGGMTLRFQRHVAHQIFHKDRVFISFFRHPFFIRPFQDAEQGAARAGFHQVNQVFNPDGPGGETHGISNQPALVVGSVGTHGLGAGAQRRHGNDNCQLEISQFVVRFRLHLKPDNVIHEPFNSGHRSVFGAEKREFHFHMGTAGGQVPAEWPGPYAHPAKGHAGATPPQNGSYGCP